LNQLAFSTLGCPAWDLDRIISGAVEYGYDAVEIRGYLEQMDLPLAWPFTAENRAETHRKFEDAGIEVCCISSSGIVAQKNVDHVRAHSELAQALGAPLVRVFGGRLTENVPHHEAIAIAAESLREFGDVAAENGVSIVLESHDDFSTGVQVAELIAAAAHPSVFSLWDLHHPFRQGESPETTFGYLKDTVRHVHIKDGLPPDHYTLFGEGDIPLIPMLDLLLENGYTGPISLEWEKRWHADLPEPEIAFPQHAKALRAYLNGREK
jgi:sugar phosphate isomerase/epimerase